MESPTITPERTIGSIVADDFRTAAVFSQHGIDFCCRGGRSLEEVCKKNGLDQATIEQELRLAMDRNNDSNDDYRTWTMGRLIEHIERVHHRYVESRSLTLLQFLDKLCKVHGDRHPELFDIQREFHECAGAMAAHMKKEELLLFPFINQLEKGEAARHHPAHAAFRHGGQPHCHDGAGPRCRRRALPPHRRN
jgi:regulator of cell morphogenesis and NO signaling